MLLYDATGLFGFFWIILELQKTSAQLAMRADVVRIILPAYFILLCGLFLPATHFTSVLINWGRRRRKPVLGFREKQWWRILLGFLVVLICLSFAAAWSIGVPLRERAAAAGYIECDGLFDRLDRHRVVETYALSADLCRQAGFKRSRIEPDFHTPQPSG
ncbi:hypothetical protein KXS07_20055 [Inquilinus limosus]|uniref:hypothetical protein n=1 Tax=Inquilinus limosus TaxID=171674 RepID=UPI003F135F87